MDARFENLTKIVAQPAAKSLAEANARLETKLEAPASASLEVVLEELQGKAAFVDILRLMSVVLPARERVWWACLAARDIVGEGDENATPSLRASEAWVFRPTEENRMEAITCLDVAPPEDDTINCALGIMYADGTLGPGAMAEHLAPPGAASVAAFAMNVDALGSRIAVFDDYVQVLIDRALDIGRGGDGRIPATPVPAEEA